MVVVAREQIEDPPIDQARVWLGRPAHHFPPGRAAGLVYPDSRLVNWGILIPQFAHQLPRLFGPSSQFGGFAWPTLFFEGYASRLG